MVAVSMLRGNYLQSSKPLGVKQNKPNRPVTTHEVFACMLWHVIFLKPVYMCHHLPPSVQVLFYKRAQIFVADVFGAFQGQDLGRFSDIQELTMFADYRVPVVLRLKGILEYSTPLATKVSLVCFFVDWKAESMLTS